MSGIKDFYNYVNNVLTVNLLILNRNYFHKSFFSFCSISKLYNIRGIELLLYNTCQQHTDEIRIISFTEI